MNDEAVEDNFKPLVSAVITTRNRLPLLKRSLQSVAEQSYGNIEIIVVDDASTDGTKNYMELENTIPCQYVYIQPENSKGGNHARNQGVKLSQGEWIAFLDDDDEWFPEKIEHQVSCALANPTCGMIGCRRIIEFNFGRREPIVQELLVGDLSETMLAGAIPYTTSMIMVRRKILLEIGGFDEHLTHWQEYEMQIRLCQVAEVAAADRFLVLNRSISGDGTRLTNQLDGWMAAVEYISDKHRTLFESASEETRRAFMLRVTRDGASRADKVGNRTVVKRYLKERYMLDPTMKNWLKWKLGRAKLKPWK